MDTLVLSVTFLDRLFHGRSSNNEPEWPPSPMRLFQAMLAGAHMGIRETQWSGAKENAFKWLESIEDLPVIIAPRAELSSGYVAYVPDNVGDKKRERQNRLFPKEYRPYRLIDGDTVYYAWIIDSSERESREERLRILCDEMRHVVSLGWGIDQVIGNGKILSESDVTGLPGNRWKSVNAIGPGESLLRVPTEGSLVDLQSVVYKGFVERVDGNSFRQPPKPSKYREVWYSREWYRSPREYCVFEILDGVAFAQKNLTKVATMFRSLTIREAEGDDHKFPGGVEKYVAGHADHVDTNIPRFSYIPLPTIGHQHADGMIRRLLIVEPYGGGGTQARWSYNKLHGAPLRDEDGNIFGVLNRSLGSETERMVQRYTRESLKWRTVTPVILPGFDDGKQKKAEKLVLTAMKQAGVAPETVCEFYLRKSPFWNGSLHPKQYFLPEYLRKLPGWHVEIVFREPVSGPLSLGAGRHLGMGLFARVISGRKGSEDSYMSI